MYETLTINDSYTQRTRSLPQVVHLRTLQIGVYHSSHTASAWLSVNLSLVTAWEQLRIRDDIWSLFCHGPHLISALRTEFPQLTFLALHKPYMAQTCFLSPTPPFVPYPMRLVARTDVAEWKTWTWSFGWFWITLNRR